MIKFQRRRRKLPLFELDWQSFKTELRQLSLPEVPFAVKSLPKDFSVSLPFRKFFVDAAP